LFSRVDSFGEWGLYTANNAGGTPLAAVGFALKEGEVLSRSVDKSGEPRERPLCPEGESGMGERLCVW